MAISTYQELRDAIANWLDHSLYAGDRTAEFISLFEAHANRRLRVRQMEASTSITMSSGSGTLPADFLSVRRVTWPGSTAVDLEYVQPSWLVAAYPDSGQGTPSVYTIEGSTIKVRPVDDTSLTFLYYQKIVALSGSVNWLFSTHPDVYLFGSLCEAEMFGVNDSRAALWKARRDEIFDEIEKLSNKTRGNAGAIRVMGATP